MALVLATLLLAIGSQGAKRKISDVYLLLPQTLNSPNARHVKYTIQAYEGCYKWTTANSKVVAVTQLTSECFSFDSDCQNPALVREFQGLECYPGALLEPVAVVEHPPITLITAIDQTSRGESLKCEVKVGRISRLEILTTVKSFRVLDNQKLYAQAYDDEGNVFSGLEGLRFRWHIVTGESSLNLPKLKDSLATLSEVRREIEHSNYQSDMVLVEGKSTGVANVTLKIEEPGYENVPISWTLIYISEPFALFPSPEVYLPICSKFQYKIFKVLEKKLHKEVSLPSSDYLWSVSSEFLEIESTGELRTLGKEGKWNVIVKDSKIESNIVQCEVSVVKPDRLIVFISPLESKTDHKGIYTSEEFQDMVNRKDSPKSNWYLISGHQYTLRVVLYWRNKELEIPKNAFFSISFADNKLWKVISKSENGSEMIVQPILPDEFTNNIYPTKVSAKLEHFDGFSQSSCRLDSAITDTEEANIIRQVRIIEDIRPILLPYLAVLTQIPDKKGHFAQEYRLKVTGGSFALKWISSDNSVATVSSNGIVYAHRLGTTTVKVIDANNEYNQDSIEIESALVEKLVWENQRMDLTRGTNEQIEIKGLASNSRVFHNCSSMVLDWEQRKDSEILKIKAKSLVNEENRKSGVCEIRNLETTVEGQALILAHLIHSANEVSSRSPEIRLSSEEARIGIFVPLSILPTEKYSYEGSNKTFTQLEEKNAVLLTPGSSGLLEISGGPWPWDDLLSSHKEVLVEGEGVNLISKKLVKDKRFVEFQCPWSLRPKDIDVKVKVFNEASEKLRSPGASELTFKLACYPPATMKLEWMQDESQLKTVAWKSLPTFYDKFRRRISNVFSDSYWIVLNEQDLMLNVTLFDKEQREFYNFSTVSLDWISNNNDLISYSKQQSLIHQRITRIGISEGPVTLEARIDRMADGSIISPPISSWLNNEVVKNVEVYPKEYSLYLHRQNMLEIQIQYGSGHFDVSSNSSDIIQFTYDGYRKITVFPKRIGKVSIKVEDLGLIGSNPAVSNILVSGLANMELKEGGLIPVNSTIRLTLHAIDSENKLFSPVELKWMGLELSFTNGFQLISVSGNFEDWELKGTRVGEFQVYAFGFKTVVKDDDQYTIRSNTIIIDVFPPLEIIPPEVLLLPGAKYTLNYKGGPDASKYGIYSIQIAWTMQDEKIAVIDSNSGLVTALKIGDTGINLQMLRKRNVLTEAFGKIRVRLATSVGIIGMGPGRTVLTDSATRLIAQLYHNGEEFTDSTMAAQYTWKSNSPTVYSIFQENEDTSKQIGITGLALAGGKSDITLHVDISYPEEYKDKEHMFTSKATASVDPALYSQSSSHRCHSYITYSCDQEFPRWLDSTVFLIPPNSIFKLPVSKEEKTLFRCIDCREDFLKLSDNGVLSSGSQKGESGIVLQHSRIKGDINIVPVIITDIESIHIDKSYTSRTIALGSELEFDITYQDSIARSFPKGFEYGIDVGVEVSNSRVLQASLENRNNTLRIYSQYVGDTIVKVFLHKNPKVKDVLKISVNSVMKPVSPVFLHLGGEVQFETTHSTPAGVVGVWNTENPTILSVNDKGSAKSLQEGDTYVHYREKSMDLKSLVSVNRVKAVELGHDAPRLITNYEKHPNFRDKYKVPIRLFADLEKLKEFRVLSDDQKKNIKQNIHVRCSTPSHAEFVFVESEIDRSEKERWPDEPGFGCIVTPNTNPSTSLIANKDLILTIVVSAKGKSLYIFETSVIVPFLPRFTILGQDKQIILSGKSTSHTFLISGACGSLQVNSDTSFITTRKYENAGKCMVELNVMNTENELKLKRIEIIDSITGQKEELLVSYFSDPSKADFSSPMSVNDLIIFIALCVLLYVVYNFFKNNSQQPVQPAYRNVNFPPPRYPPASGAVRNQTPGPVGPASTPGSSTFKNISYRPNF